MESLPEFLLERNIDVEKLSVALFDYIQKAQGVALDVYKEQELAVEESKFFLYLLTGLRFKDASRYIDQLRADPEPDDEEEEELGV